MKTIKWLKVNWPLPLIEISRRLLAQQYDEDTGKGFILSVCGEKKIAGKFVEKLTERSFQTDPFGNESEAFITTYYVSKFSFESESGLIELESPPRSLRKLINEFHSLVGLGMELSVIKVDPLVWLNKMETKFKPVIVRHISSSGITIPKNGLAKISVSGKKDIRYEFSKLVGEKLRVIEAVKFCGEINGCKILAEITRSGCIKYSGHVFEGFQKDVSDCLESCIADA